MKYLGQMMARGHSIEYFIEGGRSRTGRLLQPRTGMLAMTVRSYLREPRRPVVFVPVYFGYERLVEGRTYVGELSGRPKEKESVLTLLRAIPELRSRFGKVYVSFGEPLSLDEQILRHAPDWNRQPADSDERPPWLTPMIGDLANQIMVRINAAACVTPINLVGLVLLAMPRQSMGEVDLVRQLELYASLLRQAPYSPRVWVTGADGASMLRYAESMRVIQRRPHELGDIVQMTEDSSVLTSYFRNNALHLLLMPSLIACAFLNNATVLRSDLLRLARRVYPYVAEEYFLRWSDDELEGVVDELLEDLGNHGLLSATEDRAVWQRPQAESSEAVQLSLLARATVPIIERYYLAISLLLKAGSGTTEPGSARTPVPAHRRAHVAALRAALAGILRPCAVRQFSRPAALAWRTADRRRRPAQLRTSRARSHRLGRPARASRADPQQHPPGRAPLSAGRAQHALALRAGRRAR